MPVRNAHSQALPSGAASVQACHLGGRTRLVDEHQSFRVEIKLPIKPSFPRGPDIWPVALAGVGGFFDRDGPRVEEASEGADTS